MAILVGSLILAVIVLLMTYFLRSNNGGNPSIPYATYGSYPIVGHLFSFVSDRTKFLLECSQRYGQCFTIKLFNQHFTMILSHTNWTSIIRNQSLQFPGEEFGKQIFDLPSAFFNQPELDAGMHRLYVQYLKNRDGLRPMIVEFVRRTRKLMKNEKSELEKNGTLFKWIPSGLLKLSHHMIYQASTLALFGDVDPALFESDFCLFDKNFHYLCLPLPHSVRSWFLSRELKARSNLYNLWLKNKNTLKGSEFHRNLVALLSDQSEWLSDTVFGAILTAFFFVSLSNTIPGVFWSLLYILRDEQALEAIKQEMDTHLPNVPLDINDNDSLIEDWTPEQLDSCVYLESAINETFRLIGAPFMIRKCIRETQIVLQDARTLNMQPGERFAWFGGTGHYDANLFPQPTKFVFDRFLNKKVETVPGFMPFGGGKTICPGRFFAKYEIKICVAMLLRYMEYKLEDTKTNPSQLRARIGGGLAPPNFDIPIMYRYKS